MADPAHNRALARALQAQAEHLRAEAQMLRLITTRRGWIQSPVTMEAVQAVSARARELARQVRDLQAAEAKDRMQKCSIPIQFRRIR